MAYAYHLDHIKGVDALYHNSDIQPILRCHILEQRRGYESTRADWWTHDELSSVMTTFGDIEFTVHCTPGHSPGHVTIIGDGAIITGDCLFCTVAAELIYLVATKKTTSIGPIPQRDF